LSGQPASLRSGEFEVRIMGASPEEMDGGTGESRCTITKKVTTLVWEVKTSDRAKWRFWKVKSAHKTRVAQNA